MARSSEHNDGDPFDDCELGPEAILGTKEYSGRVYSPEKAEDVVNVDVLTGEQSHEIPSAEAVQSWNEQKNRESKAAYREEYDPTPYVALVAATGEQLYESRSLVSRAAFFHKAITGDFDTHLVYSAACKSSEFEVEHEVDYQEGTVQITVERIES